MRKPTSIALACAAFLLADASASRAQSSAWPASISTTEVVVDFPPAGFSVTYSALAMSGRTRTLALKGNPNVDPKQAAYPWQKRDGFSVNLQVTTDNEAELDACQTMGIALLGQPASSPRRLRVAIKQSVASPLLVSTTNNMVTMLGTQGNVAFACSYF